MSTIRLTVTPELKKAIDYLRILEYPTLTDAEIVKVTVGDKVARSKRVFKYDDSDPTPEEMMRVADYVWSLDEGDQDEEPFWDETKLKPLKIKHHV